jgi:putative glycosyl hydrolase
VSTVPRASPYSQVPKKKGVAMTPLSQAAGQWNLTVQQAILADLNPAFWINYRLDTEGATQPGFVPMFTNRAQVTDPQIAAASNLAVSQGINWVAEYNEANNTAITSAQAAADHDSIRNNATMIANGTKVLSISVTTSGDAYFAAYLAAMTTAQPDAFAVHAYGHQFTDVTASVVQVTTRIQTYISTYPGKDLWLTEFDLNDGLGGAPTDPQVIPFQGTTMQWLELIKAVTNYAWWAGVLSNANMTNFPNSTLYDHTGAALPIGTAYKAELFSSHPPILLP